MAELFKDIIPSILMTKKDILTDEKDYNPYVVNKTLSYHMDCIYQANNMNMNWSIPKKVQYQYLINSTRSWKRPYQKWHKVEKVKDLEIIKEYYNCSTEKAREMVKLLTSDQIDILTTRIKKGGLENGKSRRSDLGDAK